ncbi:Positive regulator for sigma 32 heat shock promoters [Escherichia coli O55:H7 str. CB9615]|nr:Positive regulator for sigma 32 heat shock promoters [Escherichia coli O55:H7 str. CB9615]
MRKMRVSWLESRCDTPFANNLSFISSGSSSSSSFTLASTACRNSCLCSSSIFFQVLRRNCSSNCCSISNVDISLSAFSFNRFETSSKMARYNLPCPRSLLAILSPPKCCNSPAISCQLRRCCSGCPSIDLNSSLRISTLERRVLPFSLWVSSRAKFANCSSLQCWRKSRSESFR